MSAKTKILVTGITGYIGGAVVTKLLARTDASSFDIRAIVRSPEKAEKLKGFGVTPIVGSHNDEGVMVKAASEVDVVIAMADAGDLAAAQAVLKGLKKRFEETGNPPIFIHTSGTLVVADKAEGMNTTETVYDDANSAQIEATISRDVDVEVAGADKEGYVRTHIIVPSTIYSIARGPLFEAGISNPHSLQVPLLIKASLNRKQAGMVGKGVNVWPNVDIHELADLYSVLLDATLKNPEKTGHGRDGFYFGVAGEHRLYDLGKAVGDALLGLGIAKTPEPTTFTHEEIGQYFWGSPYILGSNVRCQANRSISIGWNPKKTSEDLLKSIRPEVEALAKRESSS